MLNKQKVALIGVVKTPRDLETVIREKWYRIPLEHAPARMFSHIAFYQPSAFGKESGKIRFYAKVKNHVLRAKKELFPDCAEDKNARRLYLKYSLSDIRQLKPAVKNTSATRISFGYASLERLLKARDILGIFDVPALEKTVYDALKRENLNFSPEHVIRHNGKCRYRLDFALFCKNGRLNIECDGKKWHSHPPQKKKDKQRDEWLKRRGWTILRLDEDAITKKLPQTMRRIKDEIRKLERG